MLARCAEGFGDGTGVGAAAADVMNFCHAGTSGKKRKLGQTAGGLAPFETALGWGTAPEAPGGVPESTGKAEMGDRRGKWEIRKLEMGDGRLGKSCKLKS